MEDYDSSIEARYLMYWDEGIYTYGQMSQKFPLYAFKQIEKKSTFTTTFKQSYNDNMDKGHILEVDFSYLRQHLLRRNSDLPSLIN